MPVVVLTARDSVGDTVSALEGGADDYMSKPFRFAELQARIRLRLRQTGGQFLKYPNVSGVLGHQVDDVRGGSGDGNPASSIQSQQAHLRSKSRAALTIGLAQPGVRCKSCSASG